MPKDTKTPAPTFVEFGQTVTDRGWSFYVKRDYDTGEWIADSFPAHPGADAWQVFNESRGESQVTDPAGANAAIAAFVAAVEEWDDEGDREVATHWIGRALDDLRDELHDCTSFED